VSPSSLLSVFSLYFLSSLFITFCLPSSFQVYIVNLITRCLQIYYPILFLGIIAAGGISAGTNPSYTPYELAHAIRTAHIKYFIAEPPVLPNVLTASKECGIPTSNIFAFDVSGQGGLPGEIKSWTTLMEHGECDWERFDDLERSEGTAIARLFSSGTTGVAKALDMSCYNFVGFPSPLSPELGGWRRVGVVPLTHGDLGCATYAGDGV
jgi:acyl-CoA synthetase (AMP-forming)/AMP-acid ligase II